MTLAAVESFSHQHLREALPSLLPELLPLIADYGLVDEIARLFNEDTLPLLQRLWGQGYGGQDTALIEVLRKYFAAPSQQIFGGILTLEDLEPTRRGPQLLRLFRQSDTDIFYGLAVAWQWNRVSFIAEPLIHSSTPHPAFCACSEETPYSRGFFGSPILQVFTSMHPLIKDIMENLPWWWASVPDATALDYPSLSHPHRDLYVTGNKEGEREWSQIYYAGNPDWFLGKAFIDFRKARTAEWEALQKLRKASSPQIETTLKTGPS